jgi:hypothetical protein
LGMSRYSKQRGCGGIRSNQYSSSIAQTGCA